MKLEKGGDPRQKVKACLSPFAIPGMFMFMFFLGGSIASAQAVRSLDRVEHLRTAHFDIYCPASLASQGRRLAGFADEVLSDLDGFFGVEPPARRIPVLLSNTELSLNGYFSPYPSNRIVLYLEGADPVGQLASLGDELRSVFLHELAHFVSMNMRSPFWSALAAIAGDSVAPTAWMMPNALIEGTAVWMESRPTGGRAVGASLPDSSVTPAAPAEPAAPAAGRLNDPAALAPVFADIARNRRRGLWDVSNVADFPGSGSLPYLYGGLFAEFLGERYGARSLSDLWRMSADGNIFEGFDGNSTAAGLLGTYARQPFAELWDEFLDWLEARAKMARGWQDEPFAAKETPIDGSGGRIGVFCADEERVYYLDLERGEVLSLGIETIGSPASKPLPLFSADGDLDDMSLSRDGTALLLDWTRPGPGGWRVPAHYSYEFATKKLSLLGDGEKEKAGASRENLVSDSPPPFLHNPRLDPATNYRYGLVRMGPRVMPARLSPQGRMELLDSPLFFIRSLSLWRSRGREDSGLGLPSAGLSPTGVREPGLAFCATLPDGLSRIAIAMETEAGWKLYLQKNTPEGGAFAPVFSGASRLVYRSELGEGKRELRETSIDAENLASSFESLEAAWIPLEKARAAGKPPPEAQEASFTLKPSLFPRAFATSRYPYATADSAGLAAEGSDLTERLAWNASIGWNFPAKVPEAALGISLSVDEHRLSLAAADGASSGAGAATPTRVLSAALGYGYGHFLLPSYKRVWLSSTLRAAGLQREYEIARWLSPSFDYLSVGVSSSLGFSTMRSLAFAPFDPQGLSVSAGLDYEDIPGLVSAFALSGALSLALPHPAAKLSIYGCLSPGSALLFHPLGRYYSVAGTTYPSAIAAPYPDYEEYGAYAGGSRWYLFGELSARIATIELWDAIGPVRMPSLPSWTIRRIFLFGGLRATTLGQAGSVILPASAFARLEIDAALLAGLAARGHIALNLEASWAFSPAWAGGQAFHLKFGSGVTY